MAELAFAVGVRGSDRLVVAARTKPSLFGCEEMLFIPAHVNDRASVVIRLFCYFHSCNFGDLFLSICQLSHSLSATVILPNRLY